MPGFNNGVMWADNVRFDGNAYPGAVTTDGQLLIGSTASPNIKVGTPTGSGGITITPGSGTLSIGFSPGTVEQFVYSKTSAAIECATVMPWDDTIPQNTEGDEVLTATITPKNINNYLVIDFVGIGSSNLAYPCCVALFQDAVANAIAATTWGCNDGKDYSQNYNVPISLKYVMAAGTTSSTTFKIRVGCGISSGAGSGAYINSFFDTGSVAQLRVFGGVAATSLTITEYRNISP